MTEDLDVASADLTLSAEPPEAILPILRRADPTFDSIWQLEARKPPSPFKTDSGFIVDLLTPDMLRSNENPMPLKELSVGAAPLQYLSWLIREPVPTIALWGPGILVKVPQPARYAIHKLILAQKRNVGTRGKRTKDLAQAAALMKALEREDPFALEDAMIEARA